MRGCSWSILVDEHQQTNLAWETGQLISSYDFDTVCWLVILGDTKMTIIHLSVVTVSVWSNLV